MAPFKLKFYKGSCVVAGRKSACALYDQNLATYDNDDAFDQKAAKGFIDIQALSLKTWAIKKSQVAQQQETSSVKLDVVSGTCPACDQAVNY